MIILLFFSFIFINKNNQKEDESKFKIFLKKDNIINFIQLIDIIENKIFEKYKILFNKIVKNNNKINNNEKIDYKSIFMLIAKLSIFLITFDIINLISILIKYIITIIVICLILLFIYFFFKKRK